MGTPLNARRALAQIEHDFQVVDEATAEWKPKIFGAIPIGRSGSYADKKVPGKVLTITEGKLLDRLTAGRGLIGLTNFKSISEDAFAAADKAFPDPPQAPPAVAAAINALPAGERASALRNWFKNLGHNDAFRHCYWNARLTITFGEKWTSAFTTAHEGLAGNGAAREAMDLYNNMIGRMIGVELRNAGPASVAARVRTAVDEGDLTVVDINGKLAWSDQVKFGEHGLTDDVEGIGVLATPKVVSVW